MNDFTLSYENWWILPSRGDNKVKDISLIYGYAFNRRVQKIDRG